MRALTRAYQGFVYGVNALQHILLLIIRLYWGYLLFFGAMFKLMNMPGFIGFFESLGVPSPVFNAWLVTIVELVCGAFYFFGFLTRIAAIPMTIVMVVAYLFAHTEELMSFFTNPEQFYGAPNFTFFFVSLILFFFGPGMLSIDGIVKGILEKKHNKPSDSGHTDSQ